MKTFITILITALLAVAATWFTMGKFTAAPSVTSAERKVLFYQSAMHPWIKSDKPGRCTICGMELTPVYEGEKGLDESSGGEIVVLTQSQIQVLHVQTAEAKKHPLVKSLAVAGVIDDNTMRHRVLSAYVDGRVDKLHLNYLGAEVSEGQPLAEFYSPSLLQAEREYRQLSGELRKNTALRLRQMGLNPAQIEMLEQKTTDSLTSQILSPISGTVVSQSVYEGQYVSTGDQLFEIADFSTMWFNFRAYEQDMPWIKTGLVVRVTTPSLPGKNFNGKITFIDPNFDEATRSTQVRVDLENPLVNGKRELLHRLYADGVVELDAPTVLTVPRSAVIETGPEAVVYIEQSSGVYEHTVLKTGRRGDTLVEVLSGIEEGEKVVTNGNLLIDGQAEMNRAFMTPPEVQSPATSHFTLNDEQKKSIAHFLKVADAMSAALAADDLAGFNIAAKPTMETTSNMIKLLDPIVMDMAALEKSRHLHDFGDIQSARVAFHQFSVAATAVLEPLRKAGETPAFQVYQCGMVNEAIPDAPKKGRWIQTNERVMKNPFFGKEMADCGDEIKP